MAVFSTAVDTFGVFFRLYFHLSPGAGDFWRLWRLPCLGVFFFVVAIANQMSTKKAAETANARIPVFKALGAPDPYAEANSFTPWHARAAFWIRWRIARGASLDATMGCGFGGQQFNRDDPHVPLFLQSHAGSWAGAFWSRRRVVFFFFPPPPQAQ